MNKKKKCKSYGRGLSLFENAENNVSKKKSQLIAWPSGRKLTEIGGLALFVMTGSNESGPSKPIEEFKGSTLVTSPIFSRAPCTLMSSMSMRCKRSSIRSWSSSSLMVSLQTKKNTTLSQKKNKKSLLEVGWNLEVCHGHVRNKDVWLSLVAFLRWTQKKESVERIDNY